jgi:hypothetical protein
MRVGETVTSDYDAFLEASYEAPWTDGFPLAPTSPEGIAQALASTPFSANDVIARNAERHVDVTAGDAAYFVLSARCRPHYLPAVMLSSGSLARRYRA